MSLSTKVDKKLRKSKLNLTYSILFSLFLTIIILFSRTEFFNLKEVIVQGNSVVNDDDIFLASGLEYNVNIFDIKTSNIKFNLLKHPYIKNVVIKRKFPNKIVIIIEERIAKFALVNLNSFLLIDSEGILLNVTNEKKDLPRIIGLGLKKVEIGNNILLDNKSNINILNFIKKCENKDLINNIEEIDFNDFSNIRILLKNGINFKFGQTTNIEYVLDLIKKVNFSLINKGIKSGTVYIRDKGNSYYSPND